MAPFQHLVILENFDTLHNSGYQASPFDAE